MIIYPAIVEFPNDTRTLRRSIIRYPTVSSTAPSTGAYEECAKYLISRLKSVPCLEGVGILEESPAKCPVVIAKWTGVHEDWPVIILNSHYDVVPAVEADWTVDPFGAERKDGKVSSQHVMWSSSPAMHSIST